MGRHGGGPVSRAAARAGWLAYAAVAAALAIVALLAWSRALAADGPVLYGEGAVAHAAILHRSLAEYRDPGGSVFVAANYPPLYFALGSLGDPFVTGRLVSVAATLAVAALVGWRARTGPRAVAVTLAFGWLALAPVAIWGAAMKPDLVALACTVAAVVLLEARRPTVAAPLLVAAALAKPTALVPFGALLVWALLRDRRLALRFAIAGSAAAAVALLLLLPFGYADLWRHVVTWNALAWSPEQALLLVLVGLVTYGAALGGGVLARGFAGPLGAYAAAGLVIVLLGGREGGTINYLLDLSAACFLALASVASRLARSPLYPVAAIANAVVATLVLNPLGLLPDRAATTGAWGRVERIDAVRAALASDDAILAEDSALLVATGHRVVVDDLFLWSRLAARGVIDPAPLVADVRAGRFGAVLSEVELERIGDAPAFERSRWEPELLGAIVARYRLERRLPGDLYLYRPR